MRFFFFVRHYLSRPWRRFKDYSKIDTQQWRHDLSSEKIKSLLILPVNFWSIQDWNDFWSWQRTKQYSHWKGRTYFQYLSALYPLKTGDMKSYWNACSVQIWEDCFRQTYSNGTYAFHSQRTVLFIVCYCLLSNRVLFIVYFKDDSSNLQKRLELFLKMRLNLIKKINP